MACPGLGPVTAQAHVKYQSISHPAKYAKYPAKYPKSPKGALQDFNARPCVRAAVPATHSDRQKGVLGEGGPVEAAPAR